MKIRMLSSLTGPDYHLGIGEDPDALPEPHRLCDRQKQNLVDAGFAELDEAEGSPKKPVPAKKSA